MRGVAVAAAEEDSVEVVAAGVASVVEDTAEEDSAEEDMVAARKWPRDQPPDPHPGQPRP